MNKEQLRKSIGQYVRIRPQAEHFDGSKELPTLDDDWIIGRVDAHVELSNTRTGDTAILGFDHIHSYYSDPGRDSGGVKYGFLQLNVQVSVGGRPCKIEPLPPGFWGEQPNPFAFPATPRCFGRHEEVEEIVTTLLAERPEPIPIIGPPGIGKTTVALAAVNDGRVVERYARERFFVRCDSLHTHEALVGEIATVLNLPLRPRLERSVLEALEDSAPAVLVIDNLETPWEADTRRIEELLALLVAVPGLAVIVSLRGATRPLGTPWKAAIEPPNLRVADATKAFVTIAGDRFVRDPHLHDLLTALDGVPLAITLMAYAAESEPNLNGIWSRWQQERTRMLKRASADHRLLNIEVSYELSIQGPRMTDEARRFLSVLGFLQSGVAVDDLDLVFPGHGMVAAGILRQVGLAFDEAHRLRLLLPLREYVQRVHSADAETLRPAISHYIGLAMSADEKVGREGGATISSRLTPEVANIEGVIAKTLKEDDFELGIKAALSFGQFSRFTGLGATSTLETAFEIAWAQNKPVLAAACLLRLSDITFTRSDHEAAKRQCEQAQSILKQIDHSVLMQMDNPLAGLATIDMPNTLLAGCALRLGNIAFGRSELDQAHRLYEESLSLYKTAGDAYGQANSIQRLGNVALQNSNHDEAQRRYEEARVLHQSLRDLLGEANCIKGLGDIAYDRFEHKTAHNYYEQARELYRSGALVVGEANCVQRLGQIAFREKDYDDARTDYEEALPLFRRVGEIRGEAKCLTDLGHIALAESDAQSARSFYERALPLCERVSDWYSVGMIAVALAGITSDKEERTRYLNIVKRVWPYVGRARLVSRLIRTIVLTSRPPRFILLPVRFISNFMLKLTNVWDKYHRESVRQK